MTIDYYTEEEVAQMLPEERKELVGVSIYELVEAGFMINSSEELVYLDHENYIKFCGGSKKL